MTTLRLDFTTTERDVEGRHGAVSLWSPSALFQELA